MSEYPIESTRQADALRPATDFEYYDRPGGSWNDEEEEGLDLRRIFAAIARRKFLVLACTAVGMAGAVAAWKYAPLGYTARGSLWVDGDSRSNRTTTIAPIRQPDVFATSAYLELFESSAVLFPVVVDLQLYLKTDPAYREYFSGLELEESFVAGDYEFSASGDGSWTLTHTTLGTVDSGAFGEAMGEEVGIRFTPSQDGVAPDAEIPFTLVSPYQAVTELATSIVKATDDERNFIRVSYSGREPERITEILNAVLESHIEVAGELNRDRLDDLQGALEEQLVTAETRLADAERTLEDFRVRTASLPSDQATPIAPGLEMTRAPVFNNFFQMQVDLEATRRDRSRLIGILESLPEAPVPVESLESIPSAAGSRELQQVLNELVSLRSELRLFRERYSDEYPPTQEILARMATISSEALPRILGGLVTELEAQEARLEALVADASSELSAIPVRSIQETQLAREVAIQERLYNDLSARVENARLATASSVPEVRILDRAEVPFSPSDDPRIPFAGGSLLGGLILGIAGALLLDRMDGRFRYPTQVDKELGLTILGTIPRVQNPRGLRRSEDNHAAVLESFRELRIATGFAFGAAGPLTLVITSPSEGEGKTFVSVNLAFAFAELGRRTILVDADTRRGDAHRMLGIERTPGLTDYLADRLSGEVIHSTSHEHLSFIPCGSRGGNTPELLASHRMAQFVGTLKRAYDVVIIDSPPLSGGGDALVLSSLTGHLAMVLRSGSTDRSLASQQVENLSRFPIRVLGAILNDTDPTGFYGYYPTYLPSYLTDEDQEEEAGRLVLPAGAGAGVGSGGGVATEEAE